jgi:hypothetical protein
MTACIINYFALVSIAQKTYNLWRILGSFGLVGYVVVIEKFENIQFLHKNRVIFFIYFISYFLTCCLIICT